MEDSIDKKLPAQIAALIADSTPDDQLAILALLEARRALPYGFDAIVRVLARGGSKRGGVGYRDDGRQSVETHVEHALDHVRNAMVVTDSRDQEDGETDVAHAGARLILAADGIDRQERGQVW